MSKQRQEFVANRNQQILSTILFICLLAGTWALVHPYRGTRHDATLYMGQALSHLAPTTFAHDLFFEFGSQDRFSLIPRLLAHAYDAFGVDAVNRTALWANHACAAAFVWFLLAPIFGWQSACLGLLSLAGLHHQYGGTSTLDFSEPFVTARTFAEPFTLLAIWCACTSRWRVATAALTAAALCHPLIAMPGVFLTWILAFKTSQGTRNRTLQLLLVSSAVGLAVLSIALAYADIAPFNRLLVVMDPDWISLAQNVNRSAFIGQWSTADWISTSIQMGVIVAAVHVVRAAQAGTVPTHSSDAVTPERLQHLCCAAAVLGISSILVSYLGADVAHNMLIAGLQVTRSLWIACILSYALAPAVVLAAYRASPRLGPANALLAALCLCNAGHKFSAVFAVAWLIAHQVTTADGNRIRFGRPALAITKPFIITLNTSLAAALMLTVWLQKVTSTNTNLEIPYFDASAVWPSDLFMCSAVTLGAALTALVLWLPRGALLSPTPSCRSGPKCPATAAPSNPAALASAVSILMFLSVGAWNLWDQRTPFDAYADALPMTHPWHEFIAEGDQVFWDTGELRATWMVLRRPSYFTNTQSGGIMFNRGTAVEFLKRQKAQAGLEMQKAACTAMDPMDSTCWPTKDSLQAWCTDNPAAAWAVFRQDLNLTPEQGEISHWTAPSEINGARYKPSTYHLYSCLRLRDQVSPSSDSAGGTGGAPN